MDESSDKKILDLNEALIRVEEALTTTSKHICVKCDKSVELEDDLRTHDGDNHADENEPSFSKCGKSDLTGEDLKVHNENIHDYKKNLKCDICNIEIREKVKMKSHMCRVQIVKPVFLHSEECITNINRCPDMISYYNQAVRIFLLIQSLGLKPSY